MAYLYISYHWVKKGFSWLGNNIETTWKPQVTTIFPIVSTRETRRFHEVSSEGNIRDFLPWKPWGTQWESTWKPQVPKGKHERNHKETRVFKGKHHGNQLETSSFPEVNIRENTWKPHVSDKFP